MTHEEQRNRIRAAFDRWRNVLGLDEWEVTLEYSDGEFIKDDGEPSRSALAVTFVSWEYRRASIHWNTAKVEHESDDELDYAMVHEAMHVLLNGLRAFREIGDTEGKGYERLFEEHTATTLGRAFLRAKEMTNA